MYIIIDYKNKPTKRVLNCHFGLYLCDRQIVGYAMPDYLFIVVKLFSGLLFVLNDNVMVTRCSPAVTTLTPAHEPSAVSDCAQWRSELSSFPILCRCGILNGPTFRNASPSSWRWPNFDRTDEPPAPRQRSQLPRTRRRYQRRSRCFPTSATGDHVQRLQQTQATLSQSYIYTYSASSGNIFRHEKYRIDIPVDIAVCRYR